MENDASLQHMCSKIIHYWHRKKWVRWRKNKVLSCACKLTNLTYNFFTQKNEHAECVFIPFCEFAMHWMREKTCTVGRKCACDNNLISIIRSPYFKPNGWEWAKCRITFPKNLDFRFIWRRWLISLCLFVIFESEKRRFPCHAGRCLMPTLLLSKPECAVFVVQKTLFMPTAYMLKPWGFYVSANWY